MLKRVTKQLADMQNDPPQYIKIVSHSHNPEGKYQMYGDMIGPQNSPYEGRKFGFKILLTKDYPFRPPKFCFTTKIFHPYIFSDGGHICGCKMQMLRDQWSPVLTVIKVLNQIYDMIANPLNYQSSCGDQQTIRMFKDKRDKYRLTAKKWAVQHAKLIDAE